MRRKSRDSRKNNDLILFVLLILIIASLILGVLISKPKQQAIPSAAGLTVDTALASAPVQEQTVEQVIANSKQLYTVQVSSLKRKKYAVVLVQNLNLRGYGATIDKYTTKNGVVWYRVDVGQYISKSAAVSVGTELVSNKLVSDYTIRRLLK